MQDTRTSAVKSLRRSPFAVSNGLRAKAHALIPGGCHTYAKGDDQYPIMSPGFIARGSGLPRHGC